MEFQFVGANFAIIAAAAVALILLLAFAQRGLLGAYRFFLLSVSFDLLGSSINLLVSKELYIKAYPLILAAIWIFRALAVFELYRKLFAPFPGIVSLARQLLIGSGLLSLLVGLVMGFNPSVRLASNVGRIVVEVAFPASTALSIFLLVLVAFLAWFPLPLPKNIPRHIILFSVYFAMTSLTYLLLKGAGKGHSSEISLFAQIGSAIIYGVWALAITKQGEVAVAQRRIKPETATTLLAAMNKVNARLVTARKDI